MKIISGLKLPANQRWSASMAPPPTCPNTTPGSCSTWRTCRDVARRRTRIRTRTSTHTWNSSSTTGSWSGSVRSASSATSSTWSFSVASSSTSPWTGWNDPPLSVSSPLQSPISCSAWQSFHTPSSTSASWGTATSAFRSCSKSTRARSSVPWSPPAPG